MEDKIIYVLTAHRNSLSQHSYVVGLYESEEGAQQAAQNEALNRGGKYTMRYTPYVLNKMPEDLTNIERD